MIKNRAKCQNLGLGGKSPRPASKNLFARVTRRIAKAFHNAFKLRTANEGEMRLSAAICTANVADAADGEWVAIAPYGDHPSPDGSYVQRFTSAEAARVVATWNSIAGKAGRLFKNLWHGQGSKMSCPVWDGHPDTNRQRGRQDKLLAEITELRTGNNALEGRLRWTGNARPRGPLYPSPLWWHWPPTGEPPTVYPELLESIGLVPTPNIASVPAWTRNATLASQTEPEAPTQTENTNDMNRERMIAMLGLAANATDQQIEAALEGVVNTANSLQTANAALTDAQTSLAAVQGELTTANAQLATITGERDTLQTTNAALVTANEALVTGLLDLAERRGAITPAERESFQTRLSTANTAADVLRELPARKVMNTQSVEINGNRIDLTTANSRAEALEGVVAQKMKDGGISREEAFAKCKADPALAPLFASMQDPTAKQ